MCVCVCVCGCCLMRCSVNSDVCVHTCWAAAVFVCKGNGWKALCPIANRLQVWLSFREAMKDLQLQLLSDGCLEQSGMVNDGRKMFTNESNREGGGKGAVWQSESYAFSQQQLKTDEEGREGSASDWHCYGNGQKVAKAKTVMSRDWVERLNDKMLGWSKRDTHTHAERRREMWTTVKVKCHQLHGKYANELQMSRTSVGGAVFKLTLSWKCPAHTHTHTQAHVCVCVCVRACV